MNVQTRSDFETLTVDVPRSDIKMEVRGLDFFYAKTQALMSVTLPVARNQVTALIGPSGCGKSTLLRAMNRIYALYPGQKAKGQVMLDGEDILDPKVDLSVLRARVGMVFQKPTPFPMSIFDNVAFGLRMHENMNGRQIRERVEEALMR